MRSSIRLGRIFGVPVGVNWSVLLIVGLLSVDLAAGLPGGTTAVSVVVATIAAVALFGSVLLHELAHSVVARRNGLRVDGITLWLLGGVSRLDGEMPSPGAELRVAVAGPATSVGLAVGFGVLALAGEALGLAAVLTAALGWLALVNGIVAVFNLVPAAPLDGGRVLAAALWAYRHDRDRAQLGAARVGKAFGWLLIGLGTLLVFGGGGLAGIWPALLGWFVLSMAEAEARQARIKGSLRGATVGDVMTAAPPELPGWLTVEGFLDEHGDSGADAFVVDRWDGGPAGLVTLAALRRVPGPVRNVARALDVAVPLDRLRVAAPTDDLATAWTRPGTGPIVLPHLVVRDGERIVGIVTPDDVRRAEQLGPRASLA
jgi:Zn-dependent protease